MMYRSLLCAVSEKVNGHSDNAVRGEGRGIEDPARGTLRYGSCFLAPHSHSSQILTSVPFRSRGPV